MRLFLIFSLIFIFPTLVNAYEVNCNGWNSVTNVWIYGTCNSGDFSGWDSETGAWVWGECDSS